MLTILRQVGSDIQSIKNSIGHGVWWLTDNNANVATLRPDESRMHSAFEQDIPEQCQWCRESPPVPTNRLAGWRLLNLIASCREDWVQSRVQLVGGGLVGFRQCAVLNL